MKRPPVLNPIFLFQKSVRTGCRWQESEGRRHGIGRRKNGAGDRRQGVGSRGQGAGDTVWGTRSRGQEVGSRVMMSNIIKWVKTNVGIY